MILIDDPDDPRVAAFRRSERELSNRQQRRDDAGDGLFMAEGDLVVQRALDAGCRPVSALVDADRPPALAERLARVVEVYAGGPAMRAAVTKLGAPLPVVALFERPPRTSPDELAARSTRLVLVEAVDNPANVGSIVRNASALGWQGLILDDTSVDPLARRALRVSMGHALRLPHARTDDLAGIATSLRDDGWVVCALTPADDAVDLDDVDVADRVALVVGSERSGLSAALLAAATLRVRIPMQGRVDSLNAAAATAVACWHLRQR
ncbi:MAG TPA: TrmH family RNA methyltransferase [Ilumatobacteraceae bacterium]|nr:TrmH family RNA methyltransferase [Ilumatobacteraceae bacterium]